MDYKNYFIDCCDKKYFVETKEGYTFKGLMLNYNCGNIVLYNEENKTICHISYNDIRTLRPIKNAPIKKT